MEGLDDWMITIGMVTSKLCPKNKWLWRVMVSLSVTCVVVTSWGGGQKRGPVGGSGQRRWGP